MESLINSFKFDITDYLVILMMAICILTDIKSRRIYNKVLIPFLLAGLAANFLTGGWQLLSDSLMGLLIGLAALIIPFARGGIGGGDVKLLAVIGGIKGPSFVLSTFLAGALAGGLLALIALVWKRRLLTVLSGCLATASNKLIRYGIPVWIPGSRENNSQPLYLPYSLALGTGVMASYSTILQGLVR